ncbi:hypothetical protein Tco_1191867 [Tanacetum coccineum]
MTITLHKSTANNNEGYEMYKNIEGDGAWHAKFELPSIERHAYYERLSKSQLKEIGTPRVADLSMFYVYSFDETLKELLKFEYLNSDGDLFVDYLWERALSIERGCLSGMFRLCGREHVLTLPEFVVLLGLYEEKIREPTRTNPRTSLIKEPLMRIMHRLIVESLVHRLAEHRSKYDSGLKENSLICGGHYVTKISKSLGYLVDEEIVKCSEPIECEKWTEKMLAGELDLENYTLLGSTLLSQPPRHGNVWKDLMLIRNNYMLEHSMPILHHLANQANYAYPTYKPPNVPAYPYPYVPYPYPYMHYPDIGNKSHGGGHYGAQDDSYFAGSMPSFRGTSIVPSLDYEIGGSSRAIQDDDDDDSMSE